MKQLIHAFTAHVLDGSGKRFAAAAYGAQRTDGTWTGWLEFAPSAGDGPVFSTHNETSQPNRAALEYWASGLEPIYLDGAFARARGILP